VSRRHRIVARHRRADDYSLPSLAEDFTLGEPEPVPPRALSGSLAPWSLDVESGQVVLLDFADPGALRRAPFFYQEQYAQARWVVLVPYRAFLDAWAARAPAADPVFLHSVGRCGSTWLAGALSDLPEVVCLSEPDVYTVIQRGVETGALTREQGTGLVRAATNLLSARLATPSTLVVKTRSEVCRVWPCFDAAFPGCRSLFLYRDATAVVQSFDRILGYPHGRTQRHGEREAAFARRLSTYEGALRTRFFAARSPGLETAQAHCGAWAGLFLMEWVEKVIAFLEARERDADRAAAVRYEDLRMQHDAVMSQVAAFLGHTWTGSLRAGDAQRGTPLQAVETPRYPLDATTVAGIARAGSALLGEVYGRPLPGTLTIS
jgi:hypothetical protein